MLRSLRPRPTEASFDLTPMIDVVMLLIVFFTLTSQFKDSLPTKVELPAEVGQQMSEAAPSTLFLELDRAGGLTSRGHPARLEDIVNELPSQSSANGAARAELVLRADRRCPIGEVDRVAGALAKAGVRKLKIVTAGVGTPTASGAAR